MRSSSLILTILLFLSNASCVKWTPFNDILGGGGGGPSEQPVPTGTVIFAGIDDAMTGQMLLTSDSGYLMGANSSWLIKTNKSGSIEWETSLSGYIFSMCRLSGTEFGISTRNSTGISLLRLNATGTIIWSKEISDSFTYVSGVSEKGFVLAGISDSGGNNHWSSWIMALNLNGDTIFPKKCLDSANIFRFGSVIQADSFYIFTAFVFRNIYYDNVSIYGSYMLYKIDNKGNVLWAKSILSSDDETRYYNSLKQTADKGFILNINRNTIIKTDAQGNVVWTKSRFSNALLPLPDSSILILGACSGITGNPYYWDVSLFKININGDSLWHQQYGGNNTDEGKAIVQTADGNFVILANDLSYKYYTCWLFKVNNTGKMIPL